MSTQTTSKAAASKNFSGPGGTEYVFFGSGQHGRVGVGKLGGNTFRVRIEPKEGSIETVNKALGGEEHDWRRPEGSKQRFSTVVYGDPTEQVALALGAAGSQATTATIAKKVAAIMESDE